MLPNILTLFKTPKVTLRIIGSSWFCDAIFNQESNGCLFCDNDSLTVCSNQEQDQPMLLLAMVKVHIPINLNNLPKRSVTLATCNIFLSYIISKIIEYAELIVLD